MNLEIDDDHVRAAVIAATNGAEYAAEQQANVTAEDKGDGTSVTEADREVERRVTEHLTDAFDYPVWGEETDNGEPEASTYWVVDPIDGTRNYADGLPLYATSIGLVDDGELEACCVAVPKLDDVWYAARGAGAYRNHKRVTVSSGSRPEGVTACAAGYGAITALEVCSEVTDWSQRFTAAVYSLLTVAGGANDMCVVSYVYPWDIAGGALLIEEAGGRVMTLDGGETSWDAIQSGGALAWNGDDALWSAVNEASEGHLHDLTTMPTAYQTDES